MGKINWLKIVNPFLAVIFIVQVVTALLLILNSENELAAQIHKYNGILLVALIGTHLTLNVGWVKAIYLRRK